MEHEKIPVKDTFLIGRVGRPKGLQGHFYVNLETENPAEYLDIPFVFLAHSSWKEAKKYFIEELEMPQTGNFIMKLKDLDSREALAKIKGFSVLLPMEFLPEITEEDNFYLFEIIGYKVMDATEGFVGEIKSVLELPGNPLAEVRHPDGFVFLLPLSERFIPKIHREKKEAYSRLPSGFIEAYRNL